jgi:hypothetical protein
MVFIIIFVCFHFFVIFLGDMDGGCTILGASVGRWFVGDARGAQVDEIKRTHY